MKISVDGGGFCLPMYKRFGNYTFSLNLIEALSRFDKTNSYYIYSFCSRPHDLILQNNCFYNNLKPKVMWMSARVSFEELIAPKKVFLALNQAVPLVTPARIIGFSHGLSFKLFPHYYKDSYNHMNGQMHTLMRRAKQVIVSTERVRHEIGTHYPKYAAKTIVLPFGIPFDLTEYTERRREKYFMFVGMNHPIKNVKNLISMFQKFIGTPEGKGYKLYLVGPFAGYKRSGKFISTFTKLKREELRKMYQKASGYVTAAHYESFNLPALEALSQHCPVVGMKDAIIPEMAPFAHIAADEEEFVETLKQVAGGKQKQVDYRKLGKIFSWESYANTLVSLYS